MAESKKKKTDLLDHFYEYLEKEDWHEGLDLYQAGKVTNIQVIHNLIMANIASFSRENAEVRLKIHPNGQMVQWIECTCKKNRSKGYYCEHIAAFIISLDREKNSFFQNFKNTTPPSPPARPKKKKEVSTETVYSEESPQTSALESILDRMQGSFQSVSLISHGPSLRVRLEVKEGALTHYDLDLDSSANFLLKNKSKIKKPSKELQNISVFSKGRAELGTRFYTNSKGHIISERVIALKLSRTPTEKQLHDTRLTTTIGQYNYIPNSSAKKGKGLYQFIPFKYAHKYYQQKFFFLPGRGYWPLVETRPTKEWFDLPLSKVFKDDDAPNLLLSNFKEYLDSGPIWLDNNIPFETKIKTPEISSIKVKQHKKGWFYLDPQYGTGKTAISMADLQHAFKTKKQKFFKTDGQWAKIPDLITSYDWETDESGQLIKVDTLGLIRLKTAMGEYDKFVGSKESLSHIKEKLDFDENTDPPNLDHTNLELRKYQKTGFKWLWWLYKNNLHGLLADDMGLGKTHQTMALLSAIQKEKVKEYKFLIICPTSVLDHWEDKILDFAPNINPIKYYGPKRHTIFNTFKKSKNTLITSYGVLLRDESILSSIEWDAVILDEAHYVKNNNTATYKSACKLPSKIRLCLTGTPMENHLGELKNLYDFLIPGYLGSDKFFKKNFITPIEQGKDENKELELQKLIYPFKLRRTKQKALKDLPSKVEDIRHCILSPEQVSLYRDVINNKGQALRSQLEDESGVVPYMHVFAILQYLKQICNHPALVLKTSDYKKHKSGKFEAVKELIYEAIDSGNKIVIFSQYVGMIDIFEQYLTENNIKHVSLSGKTRNRGAIIKQFQEDTETKVFVGSLLAGGIGIDLTAASVVIHYDRWWNSSKESQATDRVHRIGQKNFVQVFKMITKGTLEEKIDLIISNKQEIFEKFLEKDENTFKSLSRQNLIDLLQ